MNLSEKGKRARQLRNNMTEPEVILWSRLKRLRAEGFHIRRQAPFRGYYLDFVCFERRVAIEVPSTPIRIRPSTMRRAMGFLIERDFRSCAFLTRWFGKIWTASCIRS